MLGEDAADERATALGELDIDDTAVARAGHAAHQAALLGTIDGGGNHAHGNLPPQCLGVVCN